MYGGWGESAAFLDRLRTRHALRHRRGGGASSAFGIERAMENFCCQATLACPHSCLSVVFFLIFFFDAVRDFRLVWRRMSWKISEENVMLIKSSMLEIEHSDSTKFSPHFFFVLSFGRSPLGSSRM